MFEAVDHHEAMINGESLLRPKSLDVAGNCGSEDVFALVNSSNLLKL